MGVIISPKCCLILDPMVHYDFLESFLFTCPKIIRAARSVGLRTQRVRQEVAQASERLGQDLGGYLFGCVLSVAPGGRWGRPGARRWGEHPGSAQRPAR